MAACLSESGGSFRICREANQGQLKIIINRYVQQEAEGVLKKKYPEKFLNLNSLLIWSNTIIQSHSSLKFVKQALSIIDPKDAPVLAGAMKAKTDFLISLDKKDFFTEKLAEAKLPFSIVTPKMFFQKYWV